MSVISKLTNFGAAGAGGATGLFMEYSKSGENVDIRAMEMDSNDSIYMVGQYTPSGGSNYAKAMLLKTGTDCVIDYQRYVGSTNNSAEYAYEGVAHNGTNTLYCVGRIGGSTGNGTRGIWGMYTASNGDFNNGSYFYEHATSGSRWWGVTTASNGDVITSGEVQVRTYTSGGGEEFNYATGHLYDAGVIGSGIDASVNFENNKNPSDEAETLQLRSNLIRSGSDYYTCYGIDESGSGTFAAILYKFNSSLSFQTAYTWYRNSGSSDYFVHLTKDSNGDITCVGNCNGSNVFGGSVGKIGKLDVSSGTQTVALRTFGTSSSPNIVNTTIAAGVYDSDDNFYYCGRRRRQTNSNKDELFIVKSNSSFTTQWTRIVEFADGNLLGRDMRIDSEGNLYVCGRLYNSTNGKTSGFIVKMPKDDGLNTGTFGDYTVTDTSIGADSASITTSGSRTVSTFGISVNQNTNNNEAEATVSLTETQTDI